MGSRVKISRNDCNKTIGICQKKQSPKAYSTIILDSVEGIPFPYRENAVYYVRDGDYVAIYTVNESGELIKSARLTNLFTLENIDELRTIRGFEGHHALLRGFDVEGDGLGGEFYWDAESTELDNDSTIIAVSLVDVGRWKKINSYLPLSGGTLTGNLNLSSFNINTKRVATYADLITLSELNNYIGIVLVNSDSTNGDIPTIYLVFNDLVYWIPTQTI